MDLVIRQSENIETVAGILVLNGYAVNRIQIKDPDPKNKGYFTGLKVTGNGMLPKAKEDKE